MNKQDIIKDIREENFTATDYIKYGILYPVGLIAACFVAEFINSL